jgi:hypothetical protein
LSIVRSWKKLDEGEQSAADDRDPGAGESHPAEGAIGLAKPELILSKLVVVHN